MSNSSVDGHESSENVYKLSEFRIQNTLLSP